MALSYVCIYSVRNNLGCFSAFWYIWFRVLCFLCFGSVNFVQNLEWQQNTNYYDTIFPFKNQYPILYFGIFLLLGGNVYFFYQIVYFLIIYVINRKKDLKRGLEYDIISCNCRQETDEEKTLSVSEMYFVCKEGITSEAI